MAKNLSLHGTNPGPWLLSLEGLLGRSRPGEALWRSGAAGGQPASGAQIGFGEIQLLLTVPVQKRTTDGHRF